jgi:hypothetical protein
MHLLGLPQSNGYQLRFIDPALKAVHNCLSQIELLHGSLGDFRIFVASAPEGVPHGFQIFRTIIVRLG